MGYGNGTLAWAIDPTYNGKRIRTSERHAWKVYVLENFLVRIFSHSDWIWKFILWIYVFSLNGGKCGPEKLRRQTLLFCKLNWNVLTLTILSRFITGDGKVGDGGLRLNYLQCTWIQALQIHVDQDYRWALTPTNYDLGPTSQYYEDK